MKVISISCGYFVFNSCHFAVVPNYSSFIRHFRDVDLLGDYAGKNHRTSVLRDCQLFVQTFTVLTFYKHNLSLHQQKVTSKPKNAISQALDT